MLAPTVFCATLLIFPCNVFHVWIEVQASIYVEIFAEKQGQMANVDECSKILPHKPSATASQMNISITRAKL